MNNMNGKRLFTAVLLAFFLLAPAWAQQAAWYTGSGAEGLSIAVLVPEAKDIGAGQTHLPTMAQGVLVGDFTKFSKMRVIDRQALDKVIAEGESGYYAEESGFVQLGKAAGVQYVLSGALQKTGAGFLLQFKVTEAATGASKAAYNGNCTQAELENFSALKKASEDLLGQLGVSLTAAGRAALLGTNEQNIRAETALAKGITAQRGGTVVEALNYYYEAAKFDPSLAEAASRSSVLTADIQAGNIGQNVRNDIQRRNAWLKVLREAAAFYKEHRPVEIVYDPTLTQGKIDYTKETVDISFPVTLVPQESAYRVISDLHEGLQKTGKAGDWGLDIWPKGGEAAVFTYPGYYQITAALMNEDGKTIGSVETSLDPNRYSIAWDRRMVWGVSAGRLTFKGVDANEISDTLTVAITSVDGMDAKTAGDRGYIRIFSDNTVSLAADDYSVMYSQGMGGIGIVGYRGASKSPVIPSRLLQYPVTYIGDGAFRKKELTDVTIPDSVTSIGNYAFSENNLTSVVIPGNVTGIGSGAFRYNSLTSVVIPDGVTSIGEYAFHTNKLTSLVILNGVTSIGYGAFNQNALTRIIIPDSVTNIDMHAFGIGKGCSITIGRNVSINNGGSNISFYDFVGFYNENGKKAGTYTRSDEWDHSKGRSIWSYQPPR